MKNVMVDSRDEFSIVDLAEEEKQAIGNNKTRVTVTRGTYDRTTFNRMPYKQRYAEISISEIKRFICIMYGVLVRFYMPVLKFSELHEMKEDLIEMLTSLTVQGELGETVLELCRFSTK